MDPGLHLPWGPVAGFMDQSDVGSYIAMRMIDQVTYSCHLKGSHTNRYRLTAYSALKNAFPEPFSIN